MSFQTQFFTPHILLQDLVSYIMIVHAKTGGGSSSICSYPPMPQTSLFFYINDPIKVQPTPGAEFINQPKCVIVGQQLNRVVLDINRDHKAICIGFQPGGLFRLLGISMREGVDGSYDAFDVFGNEINTVQVQLQEAQTFTELKDIVEAFLLTKVKRLRRSHPFDQAMLALLHANGNIAIEQVASIACVSLRQFERLCKERIGLPPRLFARLARFSKAYRLREKNPAITWTSIAYECGYFDQMHMIRDFKEFAGITPKLIDRNLSHTPVRLQADIFI